MIRTLIFMGLMAMSMLIASCGPTICVAPLGPTVRETLKLVKKEVSYTVLLTTEKVKRYEVDSLVGSEIKDSLTKVIKQIDTLTCTSVRIEKTGNKEAILIFAEQSHQIIQRLLTDLKSLRDLYDISTYSQFETAAFFSADSASIPPEKIEEAKKAIDPVAQRIVRFLNDHPQERFKAVIAGSSTPFGLELNDRLSEGRARVVANLLVDQIRSYEESIPRPEWIHYNGKWMAKKEELPYPGKGKYPKPVSKRRSMVSLTWNMLPVSLYTGSPNN